MYFIVACLFFSPRLDVVWSFSTVLLLRSCLNSGSRLWISCPIQYCLDIRSSHRLFSFATLSSINLWVERDIYRNMECISCNTPKIVPPLDDSPLFRRFPSIEKYRQSRHSTIVSDSMLSVLTSPPSTPTWHSSTACASSLFYFLYVAILLSTCMMYA